MERAVFAGTIKPVKRYVFSELEKHRDGEWQTECLSLRAALRNALAEVNRLNLIVQEMQNKTA